MKGHNPLNKFVREKNRRAFKAAVHIFTIGHSTHAIDVFIRLLQLYMIKKVVDVRTVPQSRHNPQFNRDNLSAQLRLNNIEYEHMLGLGGLRRPAAGAGSHDKEDSSLRAFADYMQTKEFEDNLERLMHLARQEKTAIMCAEALPWRCHRFLIADALVTRNIEVEHILSSSHSQLHALKNKGGS